MTGGKIVISGTGCALADFIYNGISFNSPEFRKFLSCKAGDGGLSPGRLVFTDELEKFANLKYAEILKDLIGEQSPDAFNVGGPSIVSMIHASQLLDRSDYEVRFYGMAGRDETAQKIHKIISKTTLNTEHYLARDDSPTPSTLVLIDPHYDNGLGERAFINNTGAAGNYTQEHLAGSFFDSDIVCFGGTALVPRIHDELTSLLKTAKKNNCITLVNTAFDFRNEKEHPDRPWPLVKVEDYCLIDILIMDREEAIRISGCDTIEKAANHFIDVGVPSFIITNGADSVYIWSGGGLFNKQELKQLPVSEYILVKRIMYPDMKGDTTGCGDNFAGGIIASLAWQLKSTPKGRFDMTEALTWGVASGGFACFTTGGTYLEKSHGEKLKKIKEIRTEYLKQIGCRSYQYGQNMKLVLFGAGKIGRSFIGQLFSLSGYEVVFIDVVKEIIDELNARRSYNVVFKSETEEKVLKIENIRGVCASDEQHVINEIVTASVVAVSVGLNGIGKVVPLLAKGLLERWRKNKENKLDIIIAENLRNAEEIFHNELISYLPDNFPLTDFVGLVETSIGKMVPIVQKADLEKDILKVYAEPFNTLILDKKAFKNKIPTVKGLSPKENIKAWVDRKLFIHNLGHTTAAYAGFMYDPEMVYIYEALAIPEIIDHVRKTMHQAAVILIKKYPLEFSGEELLEHIEDLLYRFQNKALCDTIFRVGCDLKRKLGPEDRFSGAIRAAMNLNIPYEKILYSLVCGCHFKGKDENGLMLKDDLDFITRFQDDVVSVLKEISGFDEKKQRHLFQQAIAFNEEIKCRI